VNLGIVAFQKLIRTCLVFFLKPGQKLCPNLLIKKKRGAHLINEKPSKNRYKKTTNEQHITHATSRPTRQTNNHSKPTSTKQTGSN
jgi:hypothetical protein